LVAAGEVLGIEVLDHVIIGDGRYVSFADRGWLRKQTRVEPVTPQPKK
jgi:DNA repair protein RadC